MYTPMTEQGLQLPPLLPADESRHNYSPKQMEQWLASLPLADVNTTARMVFEQLTQMNQIDLPNGHRLKSLDLIAPTVDYLSQALRPLFVGTSFPLHRKGRKAVSLCRRLQIELVLGYKRLIAFGLSNTHKPIGNEATLRHCMQRTQLHLGKYMLMCYQSYAPVPNPIWREAHALYQQSEESGLNDHDTERHYLEILLLALATPHSLQQLQLDACYTLVKRWAGLCQLKKALTRRPHSHTLTVNLDSNQAPGFYQQFRDHCLQGCRYMDTTQLIPMLHQSIASLAEQETDIPHLSPNLLRHLITAWSGQIHRGFSRARRSGLLTLLQGLSAIHDHLRSRDHTASATQQTENHGTGRSHYLSRPFPSLNYSNLPDVWDIHGATSLSDEGDETGSDKSVITQPQYCYQIINESAGGFMLSWAESTPYPPIRVGEILGIPDPDGHVAIGVVRWMKTSSETDLVFGIELLAPASNAIDCAASGTPNSRLRALHLAELSSLQQPATLITPRLFQSGDVIDIYIGNGHPHSVRLERQLQDSGIFRQFSYAQLHTSDRMHETSKPTPP